MVAESMCFADLDLKNGCVPMNNSDEANELRSALKGATSRIRELEAILQRVKHPVNRPLSMNEGHGCSPAGFPILECGCQLTFTHDGQNSIFLSTGWWNEEEWGVWGKGGQHRLRFALGADYRGGFVDLELTVMCLVRPYAMLPSLSLVANGYFIRKVTLSGPPRKYVFRLPPSCLGQGDVMVELDFSDPLVPFAEFDSIDDRLLGIGLTSMAIQ